MPRAGLAIVQLDDDETDPHPALLAPVVAAAYALDGLDATVRVLPRGTTPTGADGLGVTTVGLTGTTPTPSPTPPPSPLPATGGGLVLGGLLALGGLLLRRS